MWSGLSTDRSPGRWRDLDTGEVTARVAQGVGQHGLGVVWQSPPRRWPGSTIGKPRRGMVDRRTATLMYAGQNRRSATRRKVPLMLRSLDPVGEGVASVARGR